MAAISSAWTLGRSPCSQSCLQNGLALPGGEHALLAEHVAELRQASRGRAGDHLPAQQADIVLPPLPVFLRQGVAP